MLLLTSSKDHSYKKEVLLENQRITSSINNILKNGSALNEIHIL